MWISDLYLDHVWQLTLLPRFIAHAIHILVGRYFVTGPKIKE